MFKNENQVPYSTQKILGITEEIAEYSQNLYASIVAELKQGMTNIPTQASAQKTNPHDFQRNF